MIKEDDYCCDYCGATYNESSDIWTFPTIEVTCDNCNRKVNIQQTNLMDENSDTEGIVFNSWIICDRCLTNH